ncbi:MAG: amidase family protein, partial [Pseudomonadota bacterium]|nr:amidase family protein [Pseudomonadota bacterium]
PVDDEISAGIARAAKTLEELGATIVDARPDFTLAEHHEVYLMNLAPIIATGFPSAEIENLAKAVENAAPDDKSANIIQARGALLAHREWLVWHEMKARLSAKWAAVFENIDVLLAPATPTPAMPHMQDEPFSEREINVNGVQRPYSDNVVWAGLASLCELPATAVPLGKHTSGLPIGMQIIGPAYGDKTTMAAARMLEQAGFAFARPEAYS